MSRPVLVLFCLSVSLLVACSEPARPTLNLHRAVAIGDLDQVKRHVYWNTDVDQPDAHGDYPLHVAARQGSVNITRALLETGADPSVRDATGATPLQTALLTGKTQVAKALIAHGVPLEPQALPLDLALAQIGERRDDRTKIVDLLRRNGALQAD
ncbi:ankyrin repeat domain-containing protein [Allochromatium tepidum]|uniref:Ankyrin repeat domain-containing protein n=1 Tax=Allochromatium tepidum TaxID=553982 RepID=A0ABN6G9V2_9GAMM|nr:ankyrin repeat domain-containing protein [Allochromatium tepidum]BCU06731.1 hypothetical protein Atep_14080 [Allochromatium tepidum]